MDTTPFHTEPPEGPLSTPELMDEYPLILTCGGRSFEFFHSEHRQLPTMRELHPQPRVLINPATAERYGIQDGQWVWIENDHGRFKQQAKVSPVVNEKTVHAEHGWWFPESDPVSYTHLVQHCQAWCMYYGEAEDLVKKMGGETRWALYTK